MMVRGVQQCKEFDVRTKYTLGKNSKLFTLHEFNARGQEKNRSNEMYMSLLGSDFMFLLTMSLQITQHNVDLHQI